MPEREPQPQTPLIIQATRETTNYAQEAILKSGSFQIKAKELAKKMGDENNPDIMENAKKMLQNGINMAASHIGALPAFANQEKRAELIENFKKEGRKEAWIDVLANWNVQSDPYGVSVLRKCKEKDIEEFITNAKSEAKDEQHEAQIQLQAEAIGKGQDLIISYYSSQIDSSTVQMAA